MIIGVPKEIKLQEHRIGLTPDSVKVLTDKGHEVLIVTDKKGKAFIKDSSKKMKANDRKLIALKDLQKKVNGVRSGAMRLASELQGGGVRQGSFFPPTDTHKDKFAVLLKNWKEIKGSEL